jgi:tRNA A-37 threonylcarbamoyl transferase component Bud32
METRMQIPTGNLTLLSDRASQYSTGQLHIHHCLRDDSPLIHQTLKNPDLALSDPACQIIKNDNTTTVGLICRDGYKIAIKRYNTKNTWHRLRRTVRNSRAENCWHFTRTLRNLEISVAPVVAWIQEIQVGLKGRSWFVSEFVDGISCLDHLKRDVSHAEIEKTLSEIVGILCKLRHKHISHGDLKATNILLSDQGPVLIDLDAMRQHKTESTYQQAARKDINRFLRNWQDNPVLLATARQLLSAQGFPTDPPS